MKLKRPHTIAIMLIKSYRKNIEGALLSSEWYRAMKAEYNFLQKNEVRDIVEMSEGKNLVLGKWHFALKRNS